MTIDAISARRGIPLAGFFFALAPPPECFTWNNSPQGRPAVAGFRPVRGNTPGLWVHNARGFKLREMRDYKRPR